MRYETDDLRITSIGDVLTPAELLDELPLSERASELIYITRQAIRRILSGEDDRLLVIAGPCSIHDPAAAREYASRLLEPRQSFSDRLLIVMRVYFEKPRTTVGWKGLINDPDLDGRFNINKGLRTARRLLLDLNDSGIPAGVEFLDLITPQYVADLISWGAIGARTTESQVHREMASGLSCPVGFKNGTGGKHQARGRCGRRHEAPPRVPVAHEGRTLRDLQDRRQRGRTHHPARRQDTELRVRARPRRRRDAGRGPAMRPG